MSGESRVELVQAMYQRLDLGQEGAMIVIESSEGMAPGPASGVMIYRVAGGKIREGWAIPTFGAGPFAF